eukprot:Gb_33985 [translate_table: standard]
MDNHKGDSLLCESGLNIPYEYNMVEAGSSLAALLMEPSLTEYHHCAQNTEEKSECKETASLPLNTCNPHAGSTVTAVDHKLQNIKPNSCHLRRRVGLPADKEHKRLKRIDFTGPSRWVGVGRLLTNRVSAQQARERHKKYVKDLESKMKDMEHKTEEMEKRILALETENHTLRRENIMLRQVFVKNNVILNDTQAQKQNYSYDYIF